MGKFGKEVLVRWTDFECERQLFLMLGEDDNNWITNERKISKQKYQKTKVNYGKNHERRVYQLLTPLSNVFYNEQGNQIEETVLNPMFLQNQNFVPSLVLLEHSFKVNRKFIQELLNGNLPKSYSDRFRPDILIFRPLREDEKIFTWQGKVENLPSNVMNPIGITILDIKITHEDFVSKKHFAEILLYMHALAWFLRDHGLDNRFFVKANGNGIVPNVEMKMPPTIEEFEKSAIRFNYDEASQIYGNALETLSEISKNLPATIETIPTKIQPSCGRCKYLPDCKETFGINSSRSNWKIDLIPYLDYSTIEELKQMGIKTLKKANDILSNFEIGEIPRPLYAELPLLKLKTKALLSNQIQKPNRKEAVSISIPKFSDISIVFDANLDPINDFIYSIGIYCSIFIYRGTEYYELFSEIWETIFKIAKMQLKQQKEIEKQNQSEIFDKSLERLNELSASKNIKSKITKHNFKNATSMLQSICDDENIDVNIQELQNGSKIISFGYSYVAGSLDREDEITLAKTALKFLSNLVRLASYLEEMAQVTIETPYGKSHKAPVTAAYYWSHEVLESIEALLERTMYMLFSDKNSRKYLQAVTEWLTPKESKVRHDLQLKKVYDLRAFAETLMGFPFVLNYTWRDIGKYYLGSKFPKSIDSNYWKQHFNYMEFQKWHFALEEKRFDKKFRMIEKIKSQQLRKLEVLNSIRIQFQRSARELISKYSIPVESKALRINYLDEDFHGIAKIWYLFSKLSGTVQNLEVAYYRQMFPLFSIAKLMAAKIDDISIINKIEGSRGGISYQYKIRIKGLSANMKISKGDIVLIVPYDFRDSQIVNSWKIRIISMEWDPETKSFVLISDYVSKNFIQEYKNMSSDGDKSEWFLYPFSGDFWSSKLKSILYEKNIGTTWLGHRFEKIMGLTQKTLKPPNGEIEFKNDIATVYLFKPKALNQIKPLTPITQIKSKNNPNPDESQKQAIINAMNSIFSLIQGPPGTGKSQTIAALVNEILVNNEKTVKILITAFSYQAMHVVLEKLKPIVADKEIDLVFVRSASRESAEGIINLVKDGRTWKLNGKSRVITKRKRLTDHLKESFIIFANPQQIVNLYFGIDGKMPFDKGFGFDYIICDESSQLPIDQFLSILLFLKQAETTIKITSELGENGRILDYQAIEIETSKEFDDLTKLVLVGDHFQLPPVQPILPPRKLEGILKSAFSYFVEIHGMIPIQLNVNYRSNQEIVNYTRSLQIYNNLQVHKNNAEYKIQGNINNITDSFASLVLDPKKILLTIVHDTKFDTSISEIEADITENIVANYFKMIEPDSVQSEKEFWSTKIGIVAPHNAQGRLIVRKIYESLKDISNLQNEELMAELRNTTFSVEKFQGSDRDLIIGTIGISSRSQLEKEEEFIYELNRFNVLTSRAKGKIILVASNNFLNYIPKKRQSMKNASRIRNFVDMCTGKETILFKNQPITVKYKIFGS